MKASKGSVYIHVMKVTGGYSVTLRSGRSKVALDPIFTGRQIDTIRAHEKRKRGLSLSQWRAYINAL